MSTLIQRERPSKPVLTHTFQLLRFPMRFSKGIRRLKMYSSDGCEILNVFRGFPTLTGFGHVIGRALHLYLDLMSSTGKCGKRFITNSHQDLIAAMHQHWASVVHPLLQLRNNRRTIPTPHNNAFIGGLVHLWWDSVHSITPYAQIAGGTPTSWRCVVMSSIQSCPYLYFYYDLCRKPWPWSKLTNCYENAVAWLVHYIRLKKVASVSTTLPFSQDSSHLQSKQSRLVTFGYPSGQKLAKFCAIIGIMDARSGGRMKIMPFSGAWMPHSSSTKVLNTSFPFLGYPTTFWQGELMEMKGIS